MERIHAPWTPEQVDALNRWQHADYVHPFTCRCGTVLRATPEGWRCDDIGCPPEEEMDAHPRVVQTWARAFMAGGPVPSFEELWGAGADHEPGKSSLDLIREMRDDWRE